MCNAMQLPPLKSLMYFKYAAELGSFKEAAERLYVTQAAISQQIRSLETHLACQLFERQTRKVTLTHKGKMLYPHILQAFEHLNTGLKAIEEDPSPTILNISVLPSFATCWLLPRVSSFQQQHPEIKIRIDPSDSLVDFDSGDADLGIRFGKGHYPDLHSEQLACDDMLLAYKPGLINIDQPLKAQLKRHNLIMDICPDAERAWQILFREIELEQDFDSHFLEIDNAALVMQSTLAGQGVGMLRRQLIQQQLALGQLEVLPSFKVSCEYQYYLAGPAGHFNWHKVKVFQQWLRDQFTDL